MLISDTPAWKALTEHAQQIAGTHLRELLKDEARCTALRWEVDGVLLDASRQNASRQTVDLLVDLFDGLARCHVVPLCSEDDYSLHDAN